MRLEALIKNSKKRRDVEIVLKTETEKYRGGREAGRQTDRERAREGAREGARKEAREG